MQANSKAWHNAMQSEHVKRMAIAQSTLRVEGQVRPPGSELRVKRAKRHVDGSDARRTRKCDGAGGLGNDW